MALYPTPDNPVPHDYVASTVGHGEAQCRYCHGTNRENAVISPNHCTARPANTVAPSDADLLAQAEAAMRNFCAKVDSGEARSKRSYAAFAAVIEQIDARKNPRSPIPAKPMTPLRARILETVAEKLRSSDADARYYNVLTEPKYREGAIRALQERKGSAPPEKTVLDEIDAILEELGAGK